MSPASVHRLSERLRHIKRQEDQIAEMARDVESLDILARQNAEAQRATGDAVAAAADVLTDHGARLERIEGGVLEVFGAVSRIERRLDGRDASDVDLLARVEREQAAREAEDARLLAIVEPLIVRAVEPVAVAAKEAAADEANTTRKTVALASGGLATVYTVVQILRELGVIQ
jgi:hypothetical protein